MGWLPTLCLLYTFHLASSSEYQLPGDVIPSHYDVRLAYDVDPNTNYSFYGVVDIMLKAKTPTSRITLHAQDYIIPNNKIKVSRGHEHIDIVNLLQNKYNMLTIALAKKLELNENYTLTIPFYGNLKPGLHGVYISNYVNKNTQDKEYLIATQFEAISARKGFPCFDEPMYKATFRIIIGHHKDYSSVSNMPLIKSSGVNALDKYWPWHLIEATFKKPNSEFIFDEFDVSVPMSTYLVAFVVSKFTYQESPAGLSTTKFRIWSRKDAIDQTSYASVIGPKLLTFYEKLFNVPFPLFKMDMIAIPDVALEAMENWGLITYRETALLYDKEQSSLSAKFAIAEVIAHELAHQWFGNLVTMKWWSDLWLNEGFATFVASLGVAAVEPTWHAKMSYAAGYMDTVLNNDALESSHPVSAKIDDPNTIAQIFDTISYSKGALLVRMMSLFLGEEVFMEGIHKYLIKYSYQNAEQDDLWQMLTEVSQKSGGLARNVTVKEIMDTWTTQTGYPLLTVTRDYNDSSLTITQKRYLIIETQRRTSESWWIPLRLMRERNNDNMIFKWLSRKEGVSQPFRYKHGANRDHWILFNPDMIALCRINYDDHNWKLLSITLRSSQYTDIPVMGRVQLISDAFSLAWTNRLGYDITLEISSYLSRETDYLPLNGGLQGLNMIGHKLERTPDYGVFLKYMRKIISETYRKFGGLAAKKIINADNMESVKMQVALSVWACHVKVPGCEENAIELFQTWMNTNNPDDYNPIPKDLRTTVYKVAISRGGETEWNFLLARCRHASSATAQNQMLRSLTYSRDPWLLAQYMEWSVTEGSEVRNQDAAFVISGILESSVGYYVARDFVYNRIDDICKAVDVHPLSVGSIISVLVGQIKTQKELDEFMAWRAKNSKYLDIANLLVTQSVEVAKINIDWLKKNRRLVVKKLREFSEEDNESDKTYRMFRSFHAQTQLLNKVLFVMLILLYTV